MKDRILQFLDVHRRQIYIFISVCVLCVVLIPYGKRLYNQRKEYEWSKYKFGNNTSKDPFGAYYFNEYLKENWSAGVIIEECNFEDAYKKHRKKTCNYLSMNDVEYLDNWDEDNADVIFSMIRSGNRIIVANQEDYLCNALGVYEMSYNYFDVDKFTSKEPGVERCSVYLLNGKHNRNDVGYFEIWDVMLDQAYRDDMSAMRNEHQYSYYYKDDNYGKLVPLMRDQHDKLIAFRRDIGSGRITMVGSQAILCNYGVQYHGTRLALEHLLDCTFDRSKPLVVVYDGQDGTLQDDVPTNRKESMYYILLENPSSRMFLWLLAAGLVLAVLVNSRRRQRAKAELERSRNSSIVYTRHLASLYSKDTDYSDLLKIEHRVLLYRLRKEYLFDMRTKDFTHISQFAELVANSHKLNADDVRKVLLKLESLTTDSIVVSQKDYLACIKSLDGIFKNNK